MLVLSEKYPELRLGGLVKFRGGKAEVSDPEAIERLRGYSAMGVVVREDPDTTPADPPKDPAAGDGTPPPADPEKGGGTKLERPAGNAGLEAWQAYAVQEGHDVADLKREDIKALFTE